MSYSHLQRMLAGWIIERMFRKIVIGVGVLALLLLVSGGIFLFFKNKKQSEYVSTPTTWSQAEDYQIKEVNGQTVVTNKKAGFSFLIPTRWTKVDRNGPMGMEEYIFSMRSLDSQLQKDKDGSEIALRNGCIINVETEYQQDTINQILYNIQVIKDNLKNSKNSIGELVNVGGFTALKTFWLPPQDSEYYKKFGSSVTVEVPLDTVTVMRYIGLVAPYNEIACENAFDDFAKNITLGI